MDILSPEWLSEVGINDPAAMIHDQCQMNFLDESSVDKFTFKSLSSESYSAYPSFSFNGTPNETCQTGVEKPAKQQKVNGGNSGTTAKTTPKASSSSSSNIISFGNSNSPHDNSHDQFYGNLNCTVKPKDEMFSYGDINFSSLISDGSYENPHNASGSGTEGNKRVCTTTRTPLQAQDHVLAERKRRERLTQLFITLSAITPGLKKLDKASVLGGTIKYIKELQECIKTLEEYAKNNDVQPINVSVKRSRLSSGNASDTSSSDHENSDISPNQPIPEVEVRVSDRNVLVRIIHRKKLHRSIMKIFSAIEKLHLTIIASSVLPFGATTLLITMTTQMDAKFSMTAKDIVKNVQLAIQNLM